jgi:chromosome segregation ATPase
MLKNWFLLASVSCGVGFGTTFAISRNLQQSALAGLGTVPAVATSLRLLSRQRQEEIDRQIAESRLSLNDLRQQEQLVKADGDKLQAGFIQLRQEVDRDRDRQVELERSITALALQKQTEASLLARLAADVLDKQQQLELTNTALAQQQSLLQDLDLDRQQQQSLQQEVSELLLQKQQQAVLLDESNTQLQISRNFHAELAERVNTTQEHLARLTIDLSELQAKRATAIDLERSADLTLANIREEISQHVFFKDKLAAELVELDNCRDNLQAQIAAQTERAESQQQLARELDIKILSLRQSEEDINAQISELEQSILLISGHQGDELLDISVVALYREWQKVNRQILQLKEEIARIEQNKKQLNDKKTEEDLIIENNPHLEVLVNTNRHEPIVDDDSIEPTNRYNTCRSCGNTPMRGLDYCYRCN